MWKREDIGLAVLILWFVFGTAVACWRWACWKYQALVWRQLWFDAQLDPNSVYYVSKKDSQTDPRIVGLERWRSTPGWYFIVEDPSRNEHTYHGPYRSEVKACRAKAKRIISCGLSI